MKRIVYVLILASVATVGCDLTEPFVGGKKPPPVVMAPRAPDVVMPESITDKNAPDRAKALREELEYDSRGAGVVRE